jgi:hypothetical protein
MVSAVDYGYVNRQMPHAYGGVNATKAASDDDDMGVAACNKGLPGRLVGNIVGGSAHVIRL